MPNGDNTLPMIGSVMTLMFGVAMIKYAQESTQDLMKKSRGKAKKDIKFNPAHATNKLRVENGYGKVPKFNPFGNWG